MIDRNGRLHVIDFNRNDYGDPREELSWYDNMRNPVPAWYSNGLTEIAWAE